MKFKYQELAGKFLPIVPIELKGKEWISYDAYVDSGASYSLFHADTAKDLNIKLESGKEDYISMADRSKIKIYLHKIKVKIAAPIKSEAGRKIAQELKSVADIRNVENINARFCLIDGKEALFMVMNDNEVHESNDTAIWVDSPFFTSALENMFNLSWNSMKKA